MTAAGICSCSSLLVVSVVVSLPSYGQRLPRFLLFIPCLDLSGSPSLARVSPTNLDLLFHHRFDFSSCFPLPLPHFPLASPSSSVGIKNALILLLAPRHLCGLAMLHDKGLTLLQRRLALRKPLPKTFPVARISP